MEKSMNPNMELNKVAREWIRRHRRDLFEREDLLILAARPSEFILTRRGRRHEYYRWSWNIHVHGKTRLGLKDFLLVKIEETPCDPIAKRPQLESGEVVALYVVPYDEAMRRKTISIYEPIGRSKYRGTRSWLDRYQL